MQLLRFGFENFTSFLEPVEVSFIATAQKDSPGFRFPHPSAQYGILPVLGVYGANASGKSNLLAGLVQLRDLVRYSFFFQPDGKIPWTPWRLDKSRSAPPSRFDIDFILEGIRYHYGFVHDAEKFHEEWLYRWPGSRRQVLFERDTNAANPWYFGPSLTGEKAVLSRSTRPNSLFLSTAAQNNHQALGKVFRALTRGIRRDRKIELTGFPVFEKGDPILDPEKRSGVEQILQAFDLGFSSIQLEEIPEHQLQPLEMLEQVLKPEAFEEFQRSFGSASPRYQVVLERRGAGGESWSLPPELESRGSNILLQRINDLLALESGVLVIDELETSLHPEICAALVEIFTSEETNKPRAQLVFTTHNRDLLGKLRRDEILLVDKLSDGRSVVTSVAEFKNLRGRDDRRQLYEDGRIGGVPILSAIDPWSS